MKKNITSLKVVWAVLVCAFLFPGLVQAQHRIAIDVQEWPTGKVVLTTGETLYGALTYYRTQEIINVQHEDGSLTSLSPVNVDYFVAQEMPSGRSYTFKALPWDLGRDYSNFKKPTFFEELNSGSLSLLVRETYIKRDPNNMAAFSRDNYYDPSLRNSVERFGDEVKELYYVLLPDGNIVPLRNIRKDLLTLFGKKSKEVKSYVKQKKLEYEKPHELIAIINYFNTLSNTTTSRAF